MSTHLRDDNECQNCGYTVDVAYCSKCGQKNTETRQPFHHLFTHFIEDLVHYDGAFWKTIKHLLLRPARLTKEYLEGKRQTYVAPVKLYIFISFVTFFLFALFSNNDEDTGNNSTPATVDKEVIIEPVHIDMTLEGRHFGSIKELQEYLNSDEENFNFFTYWTAKVILKMAVKNTDPRDIGKEYLHLLPKVLFLYLPIFAFWLWLFHGKKRWYFFDHGIFTLHYFSFLLLLISVFSILLWLLFFSQSDYADYIASTLTILFLIYSFLYFFMAHKRMYGEKRWISVSKGIILFCINIICFSAVTVAGLVYTILNTD